MAMLQGLHNVCFKYVLAYFIVTEWFNLGYRLLSFTYAARSPSFISNVQAQQFTMANTGFFDWGFRLKMV